MIRVIRSNPSDPDFIKLIGLLDEELALIDGDEHDFYSQFNTIENIAYVAIAYDNGHPVGCGALKEFDDSAAEIKRMYVEPLYRNKGVGTRILMKLEDWAFELGYRFCVLETGLRQPDAIALYEKNSYLRIPNWGQYAGKTNSVCFSKKISEPEL
ncbi:MAG: GNAT family N-acetyltransferase [Bacteroidales bacterium]|jgi:GNAT superfamily N-acetyltransferase|nr:GNAT family N-acetyltransferase [Bacteroidales bacterium]